MKNYNYCDTIINYMVRPPADPRAESALVIAATALLASVLAVTPGWTHEAFALLALAAVIVAAASTRIWRIRGNIVHNHSEKRQCHLRQGPTQPFSRICQR